MHIETIEGTTLTGTIEIDEFPENPREMYDHFATFMIRHPRYSLGDTTEQPEEEVSVFEFLGLLDHSGLHLYTGGGPHWSDTAGWDSGTVGYAYVTRSQMIAEYGEDTPATRALARKVIHGEILEYDAYLRGDVFGFEVHNERGIPLDSCWGFYDVGDAREALLEAMKGLED